MLVWKGLWWQKTSAARYSWLKEAQQYRKDGVKGLWSWKWQISHWQLVRWCCSESNQHSLYFVYTMIKFNTSKLRRANLSLWNYFPPVCLLNKGMIYGFILTLTNGSLRKKDCFHRLSFCTLEQESADQWSCFSMPDTTSWALLWCIKSHTVKTSHPKWEDTTGWVLCLSICDLFASLPKRVCVSAVIPTLLTIMQSELLTCLEMTKQQNVWHIQLLSLITGNTNTSIAIEWALAELYWCSHARHMELLTMLVPLGFVSCKIHFQSGTFLPLFLLVVVAAALA